MAVDSEPGRDEGDFLATLCKLFGTLHQTSSDSERNDTDFIIRSFCRADGPRFVLACASIISAQHSTAIVGMAFHYFQQALTPTRDDPLAAIRAGWDARLDQGQADYIRGIIMECFTHADPIVRGLAATALPFLFAVDLTGSFDVFQILGNLLTKPRLREYAPTALQALRGICESGVISRLTCDLTTEMDDDLRHHRDVFLTVLKQFQDLHPDYVGEVVLALAAVIRASPGLFAGDEQGNLLDLVRDALTGLQDVGLYEDLHKLLFADFQTFYDADKSAILRIVEYGRMGVFCQIAPLIQISLRFYIDVCQWEFERHDLSEKITKYEAVLWAVAEANHRDFHPWVPPPVHFVANKIAATVAQPVADLVLDAAELEIYDSAPVDLLSLLMKHEAEIVFVAITAAITRPAQRAPLLPRAFLRCVDVLCSERDSPNVIALYVLCQLDNVLDHARGEDTGVAALALSVFRHAIRFVGHRLAGDALLTYGTTVMSLKDRGEAIFSPLLGCVRRICQCPPASDPRFDQRELIDATDELFYGRIAETRNLDLIRRGSKLRIQLSRILADAAPDSLRHYLAFVVAKLGESPTTDKTVNLFMCECDLSMIASMFRLHGPMLVVEAPPTIATLSGLLEQNQIAPSDDLIAAFTMIVRAFPATSADPDLFEPMRGFALTAIERGDPQLTAQLSCLIAALATCHPGLYGDRLFEISLAVCNAISDPSCLMPTRPKLIKGVASILKAFPPPVATELLGNCLGSCLPADWQWRPSDIDESNGMYQAIFKLLSVVICAGAQDEEFLAREGPGWVGMLTEFVRGSISYAVDKTLKSYALFIRDAVRLPLSGWYELIRIRIRVPLVLGMLSSDLAVGKAARLAWNAFLPSRNKNPATE